MRGKVRIMALAAASLLASPLHRQVGWLPALEDAIGVWRLRAGTRRGPSFNGEAGYFHRR
jgi:hypothetical protein